MKELIIIASLLGDCIVTSYRSVPNQTDDSPYITSIGEHVHPHGVAVSRDWLRSGMIKYGDVVYIEEIGWKVVNDTMHERWQERFDVWVDKAQDEKRFHAKYGKRKLRVWLVKGALDERARRRERAAK